VAATTCPGCGAPTGLLAVEALHAGDGVATTTDVDLGGGGGRRRTGLLAGSALAAGVLAVAAVLGSAGGSDRERATPTTLPAPATSITSAPSTAPPMDGRRSPTDTRGPNEDVLTVDAAGELRPFTSGAGGLGSLSIGGSVLALTQGGELVRFDPDNGGGVRRIVAGPAAGGSGGSPRQAVPLASGVVVVDAGGDARFVPHEPSRPARALPDVDRGSLGYVAATGPDQVWLVRRVRGATTASLIEATSGREGVAHRLPALTVPLADDGGGGLLLDAVDGTLRIDGATGEVSRVSPGKVLAATATTLVDSVCDDAGACRWRMLDRTSGREVSGGAFSPYLPGPVPRLGTLSADARQLALATASGWIAVIDLATGATTAHRGDVAAAELPGVAWSPEGSLVWLDRQARVRAWSPRTDVAVADVAPALPDLAAVTVVATP
jgi:hypothetical protein